jgi:glycosyltransferase involved in cell wall biosynthesis
MKTPNEMLTEPRGERLEEPPTEGRLAAPEEFPQGVIRPISFEIPDRLTDVTSWHGHIPFAFWMIDALRPRILVELGTHKGDSYCAFAQAVDHLGLSTLCYAIDSWHGDQHAGFYGDEVFEDLRQYHDPRYGRFSRLVRSTFDGASPQFADGTIDLLHIDGLHTYDAVKHDFDMWRARLSDRAVVLFHDVNVHESNFGVWRLWDELARDFPFFAFHHSHGLGVLAVGSEVARPIQRLTRYDEREAEQVRVFFARLGGELLLRTENAAAVHELVTAREQARLNRLRNEQLELEMTGLSADNATFQSELTEARTENKRLIARAEALRNENALLEVRTHEYEMATHTLRTEMERLWKSGSWKMLRPLRNLIRRTNGLKEEAEPLARSHAEAFQTIIAIRQSLSWELAMPLRLAHRIGSRFRAGSQSAPAVSGERATNWSQGSAWDELIFRGAVLPGHNSAGNVGASGKPRVFFVSHEATRTGAPLILLQLIRHFAQSGLYELFLFSDAPGPLLSRFQEHAHVVQRWNHDVFGKPPLIDDLIHELGPHRPILALCNTSVVPHYSEVFKRFGIPVITLVHELGDRIPEYDLHRIYKTSDKIVFPAEFVRETVNAKVLLPKDKGTVIPQGLLHPEILTKDRFSSHRLVCRELGVPEESFLVVGCGTFDPRKGSDLFIDLARKVLEKNDGPIHLIWVGDDYKEYPLGFFLRKDLANYGIADHVHFVGQQDNPARFFLAANVFVLTSREDPFPCVVHEAMAAGAIVVAFAGAGGAPEALAGGCGFVVGYGDVDAMAGAIFKIYRDPQEAARVSELAKNRVTEKYRFEDYYQALINLARDNIGVPIECPIGPDAVGKPTSSSSTNIALEKRDFQIIRDDKDFDPEVFLSPLLSQVGRDAAIEGFIRQHPDDIAKRKPCSGFNPDIYAAEALNESEIGVRNSFAHFTENGKPRGRWLTPLIRPPFANAGPSDLKAALHIHAYYPELIDELLECLASNSSKCDLFVSTAGKDQAEWLETRLVSYPKGAVHVSVTPNRGRDIGPFLSEFNFLDGAYDLVGHVHCKRTAHLDAEIGEFWRKFLWRNLLGPDHAMVDVIAKAFEDDPELGLVFPDDPNLVGWWSNKALASHLAKRLNLSVTLPDAFEFPVGTMFWCRPQALRPLFDLKLSWEDYPPEPLPSDGTILHAIERLLPFIAQHEEYRFAATHLPGVRR